MKVLMPLLMLLNLVACAADVVSTAVPTGAPLRQPRVIHHTRPALSINGFDFAHLGCTGPSVDDFRACTTDSPLAKVGCDAVNEAPPLLGGLTPVYPIALCAKWLYTLTDTQPISPTFPTRDTYFYEYFHGGEYTQNGGGVRLPFYIRYLIRRDGQFHVITSADEWRETFAPIDSPEEALSYVLALDKWTAFYELAVEAKYQYFVDTLEDTHAEKLPDGYVVNLYDYRYYGCGPHWTSVFEVHVSFAGAVQLLREVQAFKDPSEDHLCRD